MTSRIAIFLPNWIGDVAMATPALRAIRNHFGADARITGIHRPYIAEVLGGTDWLDESVCFDPNSKQRKLRDLGAARRLRGYEFDLAILMPNSFRTALIAWLMRATKRIGYVRYGRGSLLTDKLFPLREAKALKPVSAIDYYLRLATELGCPEQDRRMELATLPSDELEADRVWDRLNLRDADNVIAINTGGAYGAAKNWPAEHFAQLARRIVTQLDATVLIVCGPAEREKVASIEHAVAHERVRSLADFDISIGPLKACLRRVALMVTTDSGPRHLALAQGVPVISLFGPIDPHWSTTYGPLETQLMQNVQCRPCGKRVCPLQHHKCMRELTVDRVFKEVVRRWMERKRIRDFGLATPRTSESISFQRIRV